jgi:hypothetical protein
MPGAGRGSVPGILVEVFLAAFVLAAIGMLASARAADGCLPPAGYMRSIQGQVEIKRTGVPPCSTSRCAPAT